MPANCSSIMVKAAEIFSLNTNVSDKGTPDGVEKKKTDAASEPEPDCCPRNKTVELYFGGKVHKIPPPLLNSAMLAVPAKGAILTVPIKCKNSLTVSHAESQNPPVARWPVLYFVELL